MPVTRDNIFAGGGDIVASYNYFDIAEGVGYVVYYGSRGASGAFIISPQQLYSQEIASYLSAESVPTTYTKKFDYDFDLVFNRPQNIKGDLLSTIPIGMSADVVGDRDFKYYARVIVNRVRDGVETEIGSGDSTETTVINISKTGTSSEYNSVTANIKSNIANVEHFRKGDTLRLTVEGWYKTTEVSATDANLIIGHDPQNRNFNVLDTPNEPLPIVSGAVVDDVGLANEIDGGGTVTYLPTRMEFHVPFVTDI